MKERLLFLHNGSKELASEAERRIAHIALLRIILQHSCLTLVEVILEKRRRAKKKDIGFKKLPTEVLFAPADGTLFGALLEMLVIAANENLQAYARSVWKDSSENRACWRLLQKTERRNAERLISALIVLRNDGVEGHGLPGENDIEAECDALDFIVEALSPILPRTTQDRQHFEFVLPNAEVYPLKTIRPFDGCLICYRAIKKGQPGRCVFKVQIERNWFGREDSSYEAPDIFESENIGDNIKYDIKNRMTLSGRLWL